MAKLRPKSNHPLSPTDIDEARSSTTALRTRIQGLLQSSVEVRNKIGRMGRIDARRLARMVTMADSKVFIRKGKRQGVNTAVHILLDSSDSMCGSRMELACKACYAVANALIHIPGVSLAITSFPGGIDPNLPTNDDETYLSVSPCLSEMTTCTIDLRYQVQGVPPWLKPCGGFYKKSILCLKNARSF